MPARSSASPTAPKLQMRQSSRTLQGEQREKTQGRSSKRPFPAQAKGKTARPCRTPGPAAAPQPFPLNDLLKSDSNMNIRVLNSDIDPSRLDVIDSDASDGDDAAPLCPFCDEPWPEEPTSKLLALQAAAVAHAVPSPRPRNSKGLSAPNFALYAPLCAQHQNETKTIPEGHREGWPGEINFDALPGRLNAMRPHLAAIVNDPTRSPFYQDIRGELQASGSASQSSIAGQYATFDKCRPGYYGERGYVKIYGIMRVLFPDLPADLYSDWRLHPESFVSRILVPEAARLLIKDDLGLSDEGALDVLLRSRAFGIALHPDVDSEDH